MTRSILRYVTFTRRTHHGTGGAVVFSTPFIDLPAELVKRYLLAVQQLDEVETEVAGAAGYVWDELNGWVKA